jgi:hypothetical protein
MICYRFDDAQRRFFWHCSDNRNRLFLSVTFSSMTILLLLSVSHTLIAIDAWSLTTTVNIISNHQTSGMIGRTSRCMMSTHDKMLDLENDNATTTNNFVDVDNDTDALYVDTSTNKRLLVQRSPSEQSLQSFLSNNNDNNIHHLFRPSSLCNVDQMSGTDLAYIGDVVYELYIRSRTIWPLKRTTDLQQQVVAYVRGKEYICFFLKIV